MRLIGRSAECAALDAVIAGTRAGRSASLVLRGETGVGKTTLLRYAESTCPGALWISGVEAEARFPYAALHRLLIPVLAGRDRLPARQRAAVEVACGLADGPPDLYLVSLAALTLLARAPRLVVVDDAQWLDRESLRALAFVARRLHAEGVVLLFGMRAPGDEPGSLAGLDVRDVAGLDRGAALALLADVVDTRLDPALAEHIVAVTGGNPRALRELSRELTAGRSPGARPLPAPVTGSRLEARYPARIRALPARARTWLLLAAAGTAGASEADPPAGHPAAAAPGPDEAVAAEPGMQAVARLSLALLDIAECDYASARELLCRVVPPGRPHRYAWALPDLVEAALRSGDRPTARLAYADLVTSRAGDSPRARGLLARCTALLAGADEAEAHYRQAVQELAGAPGHGDLARAHLLYGEWLRRRRRRRDAREQLATALTMFEAVGAAAFAERTRQELRALGGSVLARVPGTGETALTPQEAVVARLARDGGTNAEIAAHLFLSASTVDYHLRKVYRKLGVRSRRQLRHTLHD